MKTALFLLVASASLIITSEASAAKRTFEAPLQSDQENIAPDLGNHNPEGTARFTFDDATKELCGVITFTDLTGIAKGVHVHQAPPGDPTGDGAVKIEIPPAASPVAFNVKLNASFEQSLNDGELYANIHTETNAKGEIRTTSPWVEQDVGATPVTCPAPTVVLGDAGAPNPTPTDAGSGTTSGGTTSGGTTSGGTTSGTSGESTSGSPSTGESTSGNAATSGGTKSADAGAKPAAKAGGCNTTGTDAGPLSLVFLLGAAAAVWSRVRRRKQR